MTVLVTFNLLGGNSYKAAGTVTPCSRSGSIRHMALFRCNYAPGPKQQADGYAEEESKGAWPEVLKPQVKQVVKNLFRVLVWVSSCLPFPMPP